MAGRSKSSLWALAKDTALVVAAVSAGGLAVEGMTLAPVKVTPFAPAQLTPT